MRETREMSAVTYALVVLGLGALCVLIGYAVWKVGQRTSPLDTPDLQLAALALSQKDSTQGQAQEDEGAVLPAIPWNEQLVEFPAAAQHADTKEIAHHRYGFSLTVPSDMQVTRTQEGRASETLVFSSASDGKEFQLFVTPYGKSNITRERLAKDIPSGVIQNMQEIVLPSGIHATMFESEITNVGPTREVWFLHNGYLFEITVAKEWDAWLSEIMSTWKFK